MAYLLDCVSKRGGLNDREDDQKNIGIRIGQGTQSVVLLLASSVPQAEIDGTSVNFNSG